MSSSATQRTLFNLPVHGLIHLLVIYVIWGSTFLAIRVAVQEGAGWDPFSMAGSRLVIAGVLLLGFAKLRGERIVPERHEWWRLIVYAFCIWIVGHGIVVWAEMEVPSGQAALIVGSAPIWGAIFEAILDKRSPGWRMILGLLLGFSGLVLLIDPVSLFAEQGASPRLLFIVLATISWSGGVVYQSRRRVALSSVASSGWQQLLASFGFAILFFTLEGKMPTPTTDAWLAWAFLLVFGSLIAFTSYVIMVKVLPTSVVLTHSYVNPAMAVFLGWLILSEHISTMTVLGAILILTGVGGVFSAKRRWTPRVESPAFRKP
jgi:drug/metabolite transporter (DMT)-like permease